MKWFWIQLILLIYPGLSLKAQDLKFNIRYYEVGPELTSGNVRDIAQDDYGFLWVATQAGLFRFDSKKFAPYGPFQSSKRQIGASDVRHIEVNKNNIWICSSYGGLNSISLQTGDVERHLPQTIDPLLGNMLIKTFYQLGHYMLLGCEKGLFKCDSLGGSVTPVRIPGYAAEDVYVESFTNIDEKRILVLCRIGIFIFDTGTGTVSPVPMNFKVNPDEPIRFFNCTTNRKNIFLIISSLGPLVYKLDGAKFGPAPTHPLAKQLAALKHITIKRAIFDKQGQLWIASNLGLMVQKAGVISNAVSNDERNLNNDWLRSIYTLYVDAENNLWLGCQNGLAYLKNSTPPFVIHSYFVPTVTKINHSYYLYPLNDSIVFSAAEDGLYKVNIRQRSIEVVDNNTSYDFIFKDPYGQMIVSNNDGLFILKNKSIYPIASVYEKFEEFSSTRINSAIRLNDSCVAMGTENYRGVLIWNFKKQDIQHYTEKSKTGTLIENTVNTVYSLDKDNFLVLSDASLSVFNYKEKTVKQVPLKIPPDQTPVNIFFDACRFKDTLFLACYGWGVLKLNDQLKLVGRLTTANGLSDNGTYKLLPWKDSLLFITTNNGLNSYSPANGKINCYYKEDGLQDNAFEETSGNVFGDLVFAGGTNGFTSIYPENIRPALKAPLLYINEASYDLPNNVTKTTTNISLNAFTVPNNALNASIRFPVINYETPEKIKFQYKRNNQEWVDQGNQDYISFPDLSYGTYHLYFRAVNENGIASNVKEFILTVKPKWYEKPEFKIAVALLLAMCVYAVYRIRIYQIKKEHRIRTKLASDLHDDLGSTMNSVKVYTNLALMDRSDKYLLMIKESVQEAITGIRDIIWVLDTSKDDIENLLARLNIFARPLCEASGISYSYKIEDEIKYHKLSQSERRNLYMMLKEAINNAIKYSEAKKVEISVTREKYRRLHIQIKDDGKGFDINKASEGNGLKNIQRRTKEINFNVQIASSIGEGTAISFQK